MVTDGPGLYAKPLKIGQELARTTETADVLVHSLASLKSKDYCCLEIWPVQRGISAVDSVYLAQRFIPGPSACGERGGKPEKASLILKSD
jgi:hypothetical protein